MLQTLPQHKTETSLFLSDTQKLWCNKAKAFAASIAISDVIASDTSNIFRRDLFELACKEGFGALPFPTTYGGTGADYLSFCLVNEEFGRKSIPIMSSLGVHVLCQEPIYRFGTNEQKEHYLTQSAAGTYLGAFGLTEPDAGSDTAALKTTAYLDGDNYILNGTKVFITSGASADYFIVMARYIDKSSNSNSESKITSFIVEKNFSGFAIGQKFDMLGMRGYSTCEIVFTDCKVPKQNILGEIGMGRKVALSSLAKGRVTIAAQATGWAQGALDVLTSNTNKNSHELIGRLATMVESARTLTYEAAHSIDRNQADVTLAAMAKIQATDTAMYVVNEVMSFIGLSSLKPELLLERIYRDAKAGPIYEGTNQIQRMLIARQLLK
jgi:alkylation response protein AidB-like acyl-CoA dehydrogenase